MHATPSHIYTVVVLILFSFITLLYLKLVIFPTSWTLLNCNKISINGILQTNRKFLVAKFTIFSFMKLDNLEKMKIVKLVLIWSSTDPHLILIWYTHDPPLIFSWSSLDHYLIFPWSSSDPHMILTWSSPDLLNWPSIDLLLIFSWFSLNTWISILCTL